MTRFLLSILILLAFAGCRKENNPIPLREITPIVGKWRVIDQRQVRGDSTIIEPVPKQNSWVYEFRYDGVLLNESGYVPCCLPSQYFLNGREFKPKPDKPAVLDPACAYSLCAACPELNVTQTHPDTLFIETCKGNFKTFVREK
ncbi:hypothetical protein [Dyadobacter sp. CY323]|uniref:hypothetical protein n=1 Tax=Dyadobacter sp. CY323 TaxID=2907302 RepID=UPI001F37ECF7|nr:hypothetical protein [Dyadobacter sp. CY323]MCE6988639.1 hypothetical protein [Dyadobacter sp. CY323]